MLRERLMRLQRERGLNDYAFARVLEVPRSTWTGTRLGLKPLGRRVALAAMRAFPELAPEVVSFFLLARVPMGPVPVTNGDADESAREEAGAKEASGGD